MFIFIINLNKGFFVNELFLIKYKFGRKILKVNLWYGFILVECIKFEKKFN